MDRNQALLRHFLAAIAYRTSKALRGTPAGYDSFDAGCRARTPHQLVRHMSGVINYAIGLLSEPRAVLTDCVRYGAEVERFFTLVRELADLIGGRRTSPMAPPSACSKDRSPTRWHTRGNSRCYDA